MKQIIIIITLLLASIMVSAQKFVQINEMTPMPFSGADIPKDANGNYCAVIDIFAVDVRGMKFEGDLILKPSPIMDVGKWRLYVYVPKADKEILILKDGVMPFHLKIPKGTLISKKLYRVELEVSAGAIATLQSVDLGLPSGTIWANANVGATNPEDYGDYFAWGETSPKSTYLWSNYKYCKDGDYHKLIRYCNKSDYGYTGITDNKTVLAPSDDTATANWGSEWCMPTQGQFQKLYDNCTNEWTSNYQGVAGIIFKSKKNGNTIFFPAAGYWCCGEGKASGVGSFGNYWTSSLDTDYPYYARNLGFDLSVVNPGSWSNRYYGRSVRPVRCKN